MKSIIAGIVCAVITAFFFWYGGVDFTMRGEKAATSFLLIVLAFVIGWGMRRHYEIDQTTLQSIDRRY